MISLVGYTGFVGSNIYAAGKDRIDKVYNSKNITEAFGTQPELLIYSGIRAEKYLSNSDPAADRRLVCQAEENIREIAPKKLILISTIDVFKEPNGKDETAAIDTDGLHAYGLNRYCLEQWVRENYQDALIIRLPGLYGINIKKNFIYDFINIIPFMLTAVKFHELVEREALLQDFYGLQENGFYKCKMLSDIEKNVLKDKFKALGFTALNFTDSRNVYQFYPLSRLWDDIQTALKTDMRTWHPATEPISAGEIYKYLTGEVFVNEVVDQPVFYDYRTEYAEIFGGKAGYIMNKDQILNDIKQFVGGIV